MSEFLLKGEFSTCILVKNNQILIKYAQRGVGIGYWDFPGGRIETGESPKQGGMRETKEETGYDVNIDPSVCGVINWYFDDEKILNRGYIFLARNFEGELKAKPEEGEVRWIPLEDLPDYKLWGDTLKWLPHILNRESFSAEVHYSNKSERVLKSFEMEKSDDKRKLKM